MEDKRDLLYKNLMNSGKVSEREIGTIQRFKSAIRDEQTAREFHNNLLGAGFTNKEIGSANDFYASISSDFGTSPQRRPSLKEQADKPQFPAMEELPWMNAKDRNDASYYADASKKRMETTFKEGGFEPFSHRKEDARVNKEYIPKKVENESDIIENARNRFALTERGGELNKELSNLQKEKTDKYLGELKNSKEYQDIVSRSVRTPEEVAVSNKAINDLFTQRYGEAVDKEMQPYYDAYRDEVFSRYGVDMKGDFTKLGKKNTSNQVTDLTKEVKSMLDKQHESLKQHGGSGRNAMNALMGSTQYNQATSEQRGEIGALESAQRLLENSQEIINEAGKKGNTNFAEGLGRGLRDNFDADKWTMGLAEMADAKYLNNALEKSERGEPLTPVEEKLLESSTINMVTQAYFSGDLGRGYKAGQVTAESLPFMMEFVVNPISGSGNVIARKLLGYGMRRFGRNSSKVARMTLNAFGNALKGKNARIAGRLIGDSAAALGMEGTTGVGRVAGGTLDRLNQNYEASFDDNGEVQVDKVGNMGLGEAFARSGASKFFENQSEMMFNAFRGGKAAKEAVASVAPGMSGKTVNKLLEFYDKIRNNKTLQSVADRTQFHGILEEYGEEVYNNISNVAIGEMSIDEATDIDKNIDTFLGLAPTSLAFATLGIGGLAHENIVAKNNLRKFIGELDNGTKTLFDELWGEIEKGNNDIAKAFVKRTLSDKSLTPEQKKARVFSVKDMINARDSEQDVNEVDKREDVTTTVEETVPSTIDKVNAYRNFKRAERKVAQVLPGISAETINGITDVELFSADNKLDDTQKTAIAGYVAAKQPYMEYQSDVTKRRNEVRVSSREQASAAIDRIINKDNGFVIQAKHKFMDKPVYIERGNLVFDESGLLDKEKTSERVYYRDENRDLIPVYPDKFDSIISQDTKDELIAEAEKQAENDFMLQEEQSLSSPNIPDPRKGDIATVNIEGATYAVEVNPDNPSEEFLLSKLNAEGELDIEHKNGNVSYPVSIDEYYNLKEAELWKDTSTGLRDGIEQPIGGQVSETSVSDGVATANDENTIISSENEVLNASTSPSEESKVSAEQAEETPEMKKIRVMDSLPKKKDGKVDYDAFTPRQQYEYTSVTESEESAINDLAEEVKAHEMQLNKMNEQLAKSTGIKKVKLRDAIREHKSSLDELNTFYRQVAMPVSSEQTIAGSEVVEDKKDMPEDLRTDEDYISWISENSEDAKELSNAYSAAKELASHEQTLKPWQRELLGRKIRPDSFNRFGDRNNITGGLAKAWLKKDGEEIDTLAQELSTFGGEVTEQDVVDFMVDNPGNRVSKVSQDMRNLSKRFSEIATKEMGVPVAGPESTTGKLYLWLKEANQKLNELSEQQKTDIQSALTADMDIADEQRIDRYSESLEDYATQYDQFRNEMDEETADEATMREIEASEPELYDGFTAEELDDIYSQIENNNGTERQTEDSGEDQPSLSGEEIERSQESGTPVVVGTENSEGEDKNRIAEVEEPRSVGVSVENDNSENSQEIEDLAALQEGMPADVAPAQDAVSQEEQPSFISPTINQRENVLDYARRIAREKEEYDGRSVANIDSTSVKVEAVPKSEMSVQEESVQIEKGDKTIEDAQATLNKIAEERGKVNQAPTEAQKEVGNYRKGHVKVDGYNISIENPKGSERKGVDASGQPWSVTMNNDYGYVRGTKGVDGDHIDMFLSDFPEQGNVFVVDQVQDDGSFDEHKVMYGFSSVDEAKEAYLANYSPGWKGLGNITEVSKEEFKKWIQSSKRKTKAFTEYKGIKNINDEDNPIFYSEREYIRQKVDDVFNSRSNKSQTRDDWEYSDESINAENDASDSYSDYVKSLSENGTLQSLYDSANIGERIRIREGIETAGYEVDDLIDTSKEKVEAKQRRDAKKKKQSEELMKKLGISPSEGDNDNLRFRVVYHGSGTSFDKFTTEKIGTGEGNQSFGWGLYFTDKKDIAQYYAETIGSMPSYVLVKDGNPADMNEQISRIIYNFDGSVKKAISANRKILKSLERDGDEELASVVRDTISELQKENPKAWKLNEEGNRHMYDVEIPDNGFLHWDKPLPDGQKAQIIEQANSEGKAFSFYGDDVSPEEYFQKSKSDGFQVYKMLSNLLGGDKEASRFLNRSGFNGIEYIAARHSGKSSKDDSNFVVFDENAVKIINHQRYREHEETTPKDEDASERIISSIDALSESLNTPIQIFHTLNELPEGKAKQAVESGRNVKAWTELNDGKISIYLPNNTNVNDATKSVLHEVVGHKGLRDLFGSERYDVMMAKLYKQLPTDIQKEVSDAAKKDYNGSIAVAMDEYLAEQAEKDKSPSWWSRVVSFIRDFLRKMGVDVTLNANDVKYLLWKSKNRLMKSDNGMGLISKVAADENIKERFHIGEYARTPQQEKADYDRASKVVSDFAQAHAGAANALVIHSRDMMRKQLEAIGVPNESIEEIENAFNSGEAVAVYNDEVGRVIISNDGASEKELKGYLWHENTHKAIREIFGDKAEKIVEPIYEWLYEKHPNACNTVRDAYFDKSETVQKEECLVKYFEEKIKRNGESFFEKELESASPVIKNVFGNIFNSIVYGTTERTKGEEGGLLGRTLGAGFELEVRNSENANSNKGEERTREESEGTRDESGTGEEVIRFRDETEEPQSDGIREAYEKAINTKGKGGKAHLSAYNFQEAFQDEMLSLKILQEIIEKYSGEKLKGFENAYQAENRLGSMNLQQRNKFVEELYEPMMKIVDAIMKKGVSEKEIKDYLIAKSGLERNREFAVRDAIAAEEKDNGKESAQKLRKQYVESRNALRKQHAEGKLNWDEYQDKLDELADLYANKFSDYSGLTAIAGDETHFTELAKDIVKNFEANHDTKALWDSIDATTKFSLKKSYESGIMSKEAYDHVNDMFEYYIPMRGWDEETAEDVYDYIRQERGTFSATIKKAEGHQHESYDPFAIIGNMAESAILQGNRNLMKQKFMNMVMNHPSDVATLSQVWFKKNTEGEWEASFPDIANEATADKVAQTIKEHEKEMLELEKEGKAEYRSNKLDINYHINPKNISQHAVVVKRGGKDYVIYINGNPRVAEALNGKLKSGKQNIAWDFYDYLKRQYAAGMTSYNVNFVGANVARDVQHAFFITYLDKGVSPALKLAKNGPKSLKIVARGVSGKLDLNKKEDNYYKEFLENGGETGYSNLNSIEEWKADNDKRMARLKGLSKGSGYVKEGIKHLSDWFEFANRIAENSTRFNAYMLAREDGKGVGEAINEAKNITVNFNKKGSGQTPGLYGAAANIFRRWVLFANPIIQGLYQVARIGYKNKARLASVWAFHTAMGFALPMLNTVLAGMYGDDDDDYFNQNDYTRRNNLMLYIPKAGYIKIPLAPVFRNMYAMGDILYMKMRGLSTTEDVFFDSVNEVRAMLSVEGQSGRKEWSPGRFIAPDLVSPILDIKENENFAGSPIYKDTEFNKLDPEFKKTYKDAWTPLVELSRLINNVAGGNDYKKNDYFGKWINPAAMQHLITNYSGGVGQLIGDFSSVLSDALSGKMKENFDIMKVPVAKRFFTIPNERTSGTAIRRKYFKIKDEMDVLDHEVKERAKSVGNDIRLSNELSRLQNSEEYNNLLVLKGYAKQIAKEETPEGKVDLMKKFLEWYDEAKKKQK